MRKSNYNIKQCLEMAACTNCQFCATACPAVKASEDGELSAIYRMQGLKQIFQGRRVGALWRLLGKKAMSDEEWQHFSETVFRCTLCGNCQEVCPVGINLKDLWVSLRRDLVDEKKYPKKIDMIRRNLAKSRNVFGEDNQERAEWVEDMDEPPDDLYVRDSGEVVYFTGCTAAYFPMVQEIPIALAEIFLTAKVDFTLLGKNEWCCGFPLLAAGIKDMFAELMEHNIAAIKDKGAKEVVFACPSCYEMWKKHYPYKGHGLTIYHSTQYLHRLVEKRAVSLRQLELTVTYHDPCDLGRGTHEYEAPRSVIKAIPGINFVELPNTRENCTCCGGGGNLEMIDARLTTSIAKSKIEEALSIGTDAIITSCQQCVRTMATYTRRNKIKLQVMDIVQLIRKAMER